MTKPSLHRACFAIRWVTGLVLAVVMGAVFAGAWFVPEALRANMPILSGMGHNTAIALALAGMALLLPRQRWWLGGLVAAISAAVLLQYLFAWRPPDGVWRIVLNVDGRGSSWT
ncbi:MAG: hypothetical protein K8F26_05230, partial [Thiobacillus sp.]|nr:hypothetical protein [Thiobacillus sp.]